MVNPITRLWRWSGHPTETSRRWTIGVTTALIALGLVVYHNDRNQREEEARAIGVDVARSDYLAKLATYENARDERNRCEQRVDGRTDFRRFATGIYDYIDPSRESERVNDLREILDRDFPMLLLEDCPPVPVPPNPIEEA